MRRLILVGCIALGLSACNVNGGPIFSEGGASNVDFGNPLNDSAPLSVRVKQALQRNGQTAQARILVSQPSDDTVKLSGSVDNDATRFEAERVASTIPGVRYVVNNLNVSR